MLDRERSLLFPLYLTSFCLWDSLQDNQWHEAEQIVVLSASSKTSIGLGYALQEIKMPYFHWGHIKRNLETVKKLSIWDKTCTYEALDKIDLQSLLL